MASSPDQRPAQPLAPVDRCVRRAFERSSNAYWNLARLFGESHCWLTAIVHSLL